MKKGFQPGHDPRRNIKGRPPGTANKTTEQIRGMLKEFIETNIEDLQDQYDQLDAKEKLQFFDRLLSKILPPLQEIERLTDDQLDELIQRLKNGHQQPQTINN